MQIRDWPGIDIYYKRHYMVKKLIISFIIFAIIAISGSGSTIFTGITSILPAPKTTADPGSTNFAPDSSKTSDQTSEKPIREVLLKETWSDIPILQKSYKNARVHYAISDEGVLLSGEAIIYEKTDGVIGTEKTDTILLLSNIYNDAEEIVNKTIWPKQILKVSINSEWVVWVESVLDGLSADKFEFYTFNRKTKISKLLFTSPVDEEGKSAGGHWPDPALNGDKLLFDIVVKNERYPLSRTFAKVCPNRHGTNDWTI